MSKGEQVWRVVLATGEVREVVAYFDESNTRYTVSTHRWCAGGMRSRTPRGAVVAAMTLGDVAVAEILAPGESTRAELAAQLVAVTAERDALACAAEEREMDMHQRIRAGYDRTIADSWRAEVVRAVAAEREACAARCDAIYTERDDAARKRRTHGSRDTRDEDCARLAGQAQGAAMCVEAIRKGGQ